MTAGATLLKALRSTTVRSVHCAATPTGGLKQKTVLQVGGCAVTLNGMLRRRSILRALGVPDIRPSKAALREIARLLVEHARALGAHPVHAQVAEHRAQKSRARVLASRANKLATDAVRHGVPLEELIHQVKNAWQYHTVSFVMES